MHSRRFQTLVFTIDITHFETQMCNAMVTHGTMGIACFRVGCCILEQLDTRIAGPEA